MLTLIGSALSPYVMRVVIAARYKQLTLPLLPSMESESAGVRVRDSLGPIGRVPVLRDVALGYVDHYRIDGEYASGNAFSMADCALMPLFCIYEGLQSRYGVYDLVRKRPKLDAWWARARESEIGSFTRASIGAAFRALRELPGSGESR
jgi:glutathione S-transferase